MSKGKKILSIVLSSAILCMLGGVAVLTTYALKSNSKYRIKLLTPTTNETVAVVDDAVKQYFNATTEESQIQYLLENENSNKGAKPVSLSWASNQSEFYTVYISDNSSFENAYTERVFGYTPSLEIYNLLPDTTYYWKVGGTYSNDVSEVGTFKTESSPVRMVYVDGISNVRDMGGYETSNGKVNYGLLYRGGRLSGTTNGESITSVGQNTMKTQLGIQTELDLRGANDDDGQKQSLISKDTKYVKATFGQYTNVVDYDGWLELKNVSGTSGNYDANYVLSIRRIFEMLSDESNYPVYIHCNAGADRTGTVSFLINALLGVDEDTLIKDYEITTYSRYGKRLRSAVNQNGTGFTDSGIMQNDGGNFVAMGLFMDYLQTTYAENGTVNYAVYNYLTQYIGISESTIEQIKTIMLSGYESNVVATETKQEITLTDATNSITLDVGGATVKDITVCGISLGNNLSALNFSSLPSSVYGEREIVVKTETTNGKKVSYTVPVLIITQEITSASDFDTLLSKGLTQNCIQGYYRLVNDISFNKTYNYDTSQITSTLGIYGFRGVLDGKDKNGTIHKINYTTPDWAQGMFGMLGVGGTLKNLKIDATYTGNQSPILGSTMIGAFIENVTFEVNGGNQNVRDMNGLFTKAQSCNVSFKDVTLNVTGTVDSLLGGSAYSGYRDDIPCTFENFVINAPKVLELAHYQTVNNNIMSVDIYQTNGIKGNLKDSVEKDNVLYLPNRNGYIALGERFEGYEVKSIGYKGTPITNFTTYNDLIKINLVDNFTEADMGSGILNIIIEKNGLSVELQVNIVVDSNLQFVTFTTNQDLILSDNKVNLSLKDIQGDFTGYTDILSIKYDTYELGTNLTDLDVSQIKNDYTLHGENKAVTVVATNGTSSVSVTIPVTFVTKVLTTFDELKQETMCVQDNTKKNENAYFILTGNIDATGQSTSHYILNGTKYSTPYISYGYGFAGTIDGRGYSINNLEFAQSSINEYRVQGLFGGLVNATIKNITFNVSTISSNTNFGLFGSNIKNSTIEDVIINIAPTGVTMEKGLLANGQCDGTYKNLTINAEGITFATVFGGGVLFANATATNVKIYANEVTYIYATTTTKDGVTVITD